MENQSVPSGSHGMVGGGWGTRGSILGTEQEGGGASNNGHHAQVVKSMSNHVTGSNVGAVVSDGPRHACCHVCGEIAGLHTCRACQRIACSLHMVDGFCAACLLQGEVERLLVEEREELRAEGYAAAKEDAADTWAEAYAQAVVDIAERLERLSRKSGGKVGLWLRRLATAVECTRIPVYQAGVRHA